MGEPPLPEDGRSGAARGAVAAVLQRGGRADDAGPDAASSSWRRRWRWRARRSIGSIRCRRGWRSCSTTTPTRRSATRGVRDEMRGDGARAVVTALAEELAAAPRLDRETFRAVANQVKARTGQKGEGAVPSDSRRADRPRRRARSSISPCRRSIAAPSCPRRRGIPTILGYRERAAAFARALERSDSDTKSRRSHEDLDASRSSRARDESHAIYGINPVLEALRAKRATAIRVSPRADERLTQLRAAGRGAGRRRCGASSADELDRLAAARAAAPGRRRRRRGRRDASASRIW